MRKHDPKMKYIVRLSNGSWRVEIIRKGAKLYSKYFTDLQCGSKAKALVEAKKARDAVVKQHKLPVLRRGCGHFEEFKTNWSGLTCVHLAVKKREGKCVSMSWISRELVEGSLKVTGSYSVLNYGYAEAYRLACKRRIRKTRQKMPTVAPKWPSRYNKDVRAMVKRGADFTLDFS